MANESTVTRTRKSAPRPGRRYGSHQYDNGGGSPLPVYAMPEFSARIPLDVKHMDDFDSEDYSNYISTYGTTRART